MPDNSIAYGLLLESGQQVNIYDWMSAFNAIVGDHDANVDDDEDDRNEISPEIQFVQRFLFFASMNVGEFLLI